jgi:hypothetical protein
MKIEDRVYETVMTDLRACLEQETQTRPQAMNFLSLMIVRFEYLEKIHNLEIQDELLFQQFSYVMDRLAEDEPLSKLETVMIPIVLKKVYTAFIDLEMSISNQ